MATGPGGRGSSSELGQIALILEKGQWSAAGERLSEYNSPDGHAEISAFFQRQSADAQYGLAQIYRKGVGLDKDLNAALRWYTSAANNQHPKAQTMLGYLYQTGTGTSVNLAAALNWYQKAVDQEEPMALYNLGSLYLQGKGVTKNELRAKNLFTQAAAKGKPSKTNVRKFGRLKMFALKKLKIRGELISWFIHRLWRASTCSLRSGCRSL